MSEEKLPSAIFLMGPTAAGKTDLAIKLVETLPCEIISVDSALVYRGMDIGTAKPDAELLARAPHRLIDICDPADSYSAAQFRQDALREMAEITSSGKIPLLVGGTMLYLRALEHGLSDLPSADSEVRARLDKEAASLGWQAMHERLVQVDPVAGARIHQNDPQRIQRALEVFEITGKSMTHMMELQRQKRIPYSLSKIALAPAERALLHQRIEQRFDLMLENHFIEEVKGLRQRGDLSLNLPSMRAVGYRQIWEYLDGSYDYETMRERAIVATRQLAKRQLTWLRGDEKVEWFDPMDDKIFEQVLKSLSNNSI